MNSFPWTAEVFSGAGVPDDKPLRIEDVNTVLEARKRARHLEMDGSDEPKRRRLCNQEWEATRQGYTCNLKHVPASCCVDHVAYHS